MAISSVIGAVLGEGLKTLRTQDQRRYDEKLRQQQNAYNSPAAQVARLRNAGLNPALAYGIGAQPASTMQGSTRDSEDIGAAFSNAAISRLQKQAQENQLEVQKSEVQLNNANAAKTSEEARALKNDNDAKEKSYQGWEQNNDGYFWQTGEIKPGFIHEYEQELKRQFVENEGKYNDIRSSHYRAQVDGILQMYNYEIAKAEVARLIAVAESVQKGNQLTDEQIKFVQRQAEAMYPQLLESLIAKSHLVFDDDGNIIGVNEDYADFEKTMHIIESICNALGPIGQLVLPFFKLFGKNTTTTSKTGFSESKGSYHETTTTYSR